MDDHLRQSFHDATAYRLAILLIIGFGAHNTTEGFGIGGPLTGVLKKPTAKFLLAAGLVGGGPTFAGTVIGSFFSQMLHTYFFFQLQEGHLSM